MPRITIAVSGLAPQPYRFGLDCESVTLGRDQESNDIFINCGSVSLKHAVMHRVTGGYELRDLGSTNGIRLNGQAKDVIELANGQSVMLGDVGFEFLLSPEELDVLSREKASGPSTRVLEGALQPAPQVAVSGLPPMPEAKQSVPELPKVAEQPATELPKMATPQLPELPKGTVGLPEMPEPKEVPVRRQVDPRMQPEMPEPKEAKEAQAEPLGRVPIMTTKYSASRRRLSLWLVLIVVLIAFVVGAEMRHRVETKRSLFGEWLQRFSSEK